MPDNVLWRLNGYDTRMRLYGHRVKYGLDNFLDHFFGPFFWDHFFGTIFLDHFFWTIFFGPFFFTIFFGTIFIGPFYMWGSTPLVLREG